MNCKIFIDNLEKYVLDDLCDDLKIKMEEHMKVCSHCRELYEEEILFEQAMEEALNFDDVAFRSQKNNIMAKIDKEKYKKDVIMKTKVDTRRYIKWCAPLAAAAAFILIFNPITKFKLEFGALKDIASVTEKVDSKNSSLNSNNIDVDSTNNRQGEEQKELKEESNKEIKKQTAPIPNNDEKTLVSNGDSNKVANNLDKPMPSIVTADGENKKDIAMNIEEKNDFKKESLNISVELKKMSLEAKSEKSSFVIRKDSMWYNSPNKKLSYTIAAKEKFDIMKEERDKLFIKDLENNKEWSFQLLDNENKVSIKYAKWIDDESLFVVADIMKENSVLHEELYMININLAKGLMIYKTENNRISIVNVEKKDMQVKLSIKNNDNSNETYLEKYTIYNVQNDIIDNNNKK